MNARGLFIEDFTVGQVFTTAARTIGESDITAFTGLSGDFNPLHTDEEFCRTTIHGTRIAHGLLVSAVASGLVSQTGLVAGTAIGFLGMTTRFKGAVRAGDTIHVRMTVTEARPSRKAGRGVLGRKVEVINQRGEVVQSGDWVILVKSREDSDKA